MDQAITIRQGRVADAPSVHAALVAAKADIPLTVPFDDDDARNWVRKKCRNRRVWIAEVGGDLAGVMITGRGIGLPQISYLVTVEGHRRIGVGGALVRHAVSTFARCYRCGVTVEVHPENSCIIALLTGEGFPSRYIAG